ncbi:transporter substrate-binding domain-containing protein [Niveibacterium umoris]|uniref:Polar amino acid transport system substrate-binding protein n=1 Tax=Niveibacterium umoris TaxID=1193620 RepID=A0A840BKL1_9RHOO|nr:amino acid ABC transporter substrate-binding protein [Niveibacterium umoris]MBB4013795.1 polar amino acid transport system substrate-binding protein [Niveibacterium umoris]
MPTRSPPTWLACCTALWRGLGLCLCLSSTLQAAEPVLVTGDGYPPYADQALPGGGLATQRVMAAFRQGGMAPTLAWLPWARGYKLTELGQYDATFPYVRTPEREATCLYSEPILLVPHFIYGRPGDPRLEAGLAALPTGRLCIPFGWAGPPEVQRLVGEGQIVPERPATLGACARMVLLDRADLVIASPDLMRAALQETGLGADALMAGKRSVGTLSLHLIAPRSRAGSAELIRRFNAGLARLPPPP